MPMNVEKVPMFECRLSTLWIGVRHNVVDVRTSGRKGSCQKTDRSGESVSKDDDVDYIWAFKGIIVLWSHFTVLSTDKSSPLALDFFLKRSSRSCQLLFAREMNRLGVVSK
jgi:hypothetical protein